jgi:peptidoglycan/LPS O-acetylase OafA/YrhL
MAFILIFWLCLIVVTVVLVGAADFEPRSAALFAIVPSVLLGWAGASYQLTRRLFASLLTRS